LIAAVCSENPQIKRFETSVFDGNYVTNDIDQEYLNRLDQMRSDSAKNKSGAAMATNLETYNEG
jgi:amidophosphoribosyltransferase